jgi:hypothetical protein
MKSMAALIDDHRNNCQVGQGSTEPVNVARRH